MKKIILLLMPLIIILAFFSYMADKNYTFMEMVNAINTIEIIPFPYQAIEDSFNTLNFSDIWQEIGDIWNNVDGLFSFFEAVGYSLKGVWDSIIQIGKIIYYTTIFAVKFSSYFIVNMIQIIKFVFTYIFIN